MKKPNQKKILTRMNYLVGHLQGVVKMIAEDRYCIEIIRQNQAVISALKKVNQLILKNHLDTCVTSAIKGKSESERKRVFDELTEIFKEEDK